jgi:toxin HigB-1
MVRVRSAGDGNSAASNCCPCPAVASTFGHLLFGDVLLLRINESPDFIALNAAYLQVANGPVVVFSAGASHLCQERQDCDLGNTSHSHDGVNRNAFDQSRYHPRSFVNRELIHGVILRSCRRNVNFKIHDIMNFSHKQINKFVNLYIDKDTTKGDNHVMPLKVLFRDRRLYELATDKNARSDYPQAVEKKYRLRVQQIVSVQDERDFYRHASLHFEKLKGDRSHQYSMRINDQWHLIVEFEGDAPDKRIVIVAIEDYH